MIEKIKYCLGKFFACRQMRVGCIAVLIAVTIAVSTLLGCSIYTVNIFDGETTYKCKDCNYKYTEINSYAQGHTWDTWTASEDGYHSASCTVCGETERTVHVFVEYIPNTDATKDSDGTKTATCVVCAAKDTIIDEGSKLVDPDVDTPVDGCDHMCHNTGFSSIIWKIVKFFWKLFKMNPVCECGEAHY